MFAQWEMIKLLERYTLVGQDSFDCAKRRIIAAFKVGEIFKIQLKVIVIHSGTHTHYPSGNKADWHRHSTINSASVCN